MTQQFERGGIKSHPEFKLVNLPERKYEYFYLTGCIFYEKDVR